jgi:hypothetical protein
VARIGEDQLPTSQRPHIGDDGGRQTTMDARQDDRDARLREIVAVLLLSVTAILTAWTGFQASKWAGAMSIAFSQASGSRIEAVQLEGTADRKLTVQVQLFGQWLQAFQDGDDQLADFLVERFPEPLASAFPEWLASRPLVRSEAADSPFDLPSYQIPELQEAAEADARAGVRFAEALRHNQRSDNYTVLTVGFAAVLFFGAMAGRMKRPRSQWALLGLGLAGFCVLAALLLTYPKLV